MHFQLKLVGAEFLLDYGRELLLAECVMCMTKCLQTVRDVPFIVEPRRGDPAMRWHAVYLEVGLASINPQVGRRAVEPGKIVHGRLTV